MVSGRKWYPRYYPNGVSKMADVAEPGRASHVEGVADVAELRVSACLFPPSPTPSILRS